MRARRRIPSWNGRLPTAPTGLGTRPLAQAKWRRLLRCPSRSSLVRDERLRLHDEKDPGGGPGPFCSLRSLAWHPCRALPRHARLLYLWRIHTPNCTYPLPGMCKTGLSGTSLRFLAVCGNGPPHSGAFAARHRYEPPLAAFLAALLGLCDLDRAEAVERATDEEDLG